MTKRKRAAEERAARSQKFARRMKARLLTELLLTPDDGLDDFQRSLDNRADAPNEQLLREMQSILDALGHALQQGGERDWQQVHEAWQALHRTAEQPPDGDRLASGVAGSPPLPRTPPPKPKLSDLAPPTARLRSQSSLPAPKAPPRPAKMASTPPAFIVPPSKPEAAARAADRSEDTAQHALPHPTPPLPFLERSTGDGAPPGRPVPPDPWAPLPPVGAVTGTPSPSRPPDGWPRPASRPSGSRDDEHTGETDLLEADRRPEGSAAALPFASSDEAPRVSPARPASDVPDRPPPGRSRKATIDLPEGFGHPLADALQAAGLSESPYEDDEWPTLAKNDLARTARRWLDEHEPLDEQERTLHWDELPELNELDAMAAPEADDPLHGPGGPPQGTEQRGPEADPTAPLPPSAVELAASLTGNRDQSSNGLPKAYPLDDFADALSTLHGQPPAFLAKLHAITMEQYASMQAELDVYPERVDEVRRTLGLQGAAQQLALDDLWARRFAQNPDVRGLFDLLFTRYRAWLLHQGQG